MVIFIINITSKEEATYNMMELFDVEPDGEFSFNNYIAKSVWKGMNHSYQ